MAEKHKNAKRNVSVRRNYDEKTIGMNKSSERMSLKRRRRLVILIWLVICIAAGFLFYGN